MTFGIPGCSVRRIEPDRYITSLYSLVELAQIPDLNARFFYVPGVIRIEPGGLVVSHVPTDERVLHIESTGFVIPC